MKKLFSVVLSIFLIVITAKIFLIDAYQVTSDSMKNSLLAGDFIIGNKIAYKLKTPIKIPFTNIKIPYYNLLELSKPQRNDIVIFRLNEFLVDKKFLEKDLIKRIIGLPGEYIHLTDNKILVDGNEITNYLNFEENSNVDESIAVYNYPSKNFSYLNYGPIKVPAKGDTIKLNPKNIKFWQPLINYENNGKFISNEGTVITFRCKPITKYVLKENYYFALGDNFRKSVDSRILGFIPESAIEAKVAFIYFSVKPENADISKDFFKRIRFNRIFTSFN